MSPIGGNEMSPSQQGERTREQQARSPSQYHHEVAATQQQVMSPREVAMGDLRHERRRNGMIFRQLAEVRMSQEAMAEMRSMIDQHLRRQQREATDDSRQVSEKILELYELIASFQSTAWNTLVELNQNCVASKGQVEEYLK